MFAKKTRGFTVVELVIAIALLGIVSVTVSSRWFSSDPFEADSVKSQLIAEARLAQRTALANSQLEISLVLVESGGEWRYQIYQDGGSGRTLLRETVSAGTGVGIQVLTGVTTALGPGVNLDLTYDALGNVELLTVGGTSRDASSGIQLSMMGGTHQMCISPLGYAHDGDCV